MKKAALVGIAAGLWFGVATASPLTRIDAVMAEAQREATSNCGAAVDLAWRAAEQLWQQKPALSPSAFAAASTPIWSLLLRCAHASGRTAEASLAAHMLRLPAQAVSPAQTPATPAALDPAVAALVAQYPAIDTTNEQAISLSLNSATPAECWLDGHPLGRCPRAVLVAPGPHFVVAVPLAPPMTPGAVAPTWGKSDARLFWLGGTETLELHPTPTVVTAPPPLPPPAPETAQPAPFMRSPLGPGSSRAQRRTPWWVYAAIGTAAVGVATAIVLYETRDRTQTIDITSAPPGIALHQW